MPFEFPPPPVGQPTVGQIIVGPKGTEDRDRLHPYQMQKNNAKRRGIPFLLTFEEWCGLWDSSGKWDQRGRYSGRYCMSRVGDEGPYAIGNVRISAWEDNLAEQAARIRKPQARKRNRKRKSPIPQVTAAQSRMRYAYNMHKSDVKRRNVPFLLSFDEWQSIWIESGKWEQRGVRRGQYVMARRDGKGDFELGNVRICLAEENHAQRNRNHPSPSHHRNPWLTIKDPEAAKAKERQSMISIAAKRKRDARGYFLPKDAS